MRIAGRSARVRLAMAFGVCLVAVSTFGCGGPRHEAEIAAEYPAADEAATTRRLVELTKRALEERNFGGKTPRFNQARHAGCLRAEFEVLSGLPTDLGVGLFSAPRVYPTWIRFASATTETDTAKDFRGMSLKLMGVEAETLLDDGASLDFVLNSHPVLFVGTPEHFADFIDASLSWHPILFFLNPFAPHLKELGIARSGLRHHAGHLDIPYWSTTPYLWGPGRAVKYAAKPCAGEAADLAEPPTGDYLRDAMRDRLAGGDACFDFMVQLQTDAEAMPIEDATVEWDDSVSPLRKVATVRIPSQSFESAARMEFCENLAFNPWRSLPEHRPLGGLNRVRKEVYAELARFRHQRNGVDYSEPTGAEPF